MSEFVTRGSTRPPLHLKPRPTHTRHHHHLVVHPTGKLTISANGNKATLYDEKGGKVDEVMINGKQLAEQDEVSDVHHIAPHHTTPHHTTPHLHHTSPPPHLTSPHHTTPPLHHTPLPSHTPPSPRPIAHMQQLESWCYTEQLLRCNAMSPRAQMNASSSRWRRRVFALVLHVLLQLSHLSAAVVMSIGRHGAQHRGGHRGGDSTTRGRRSRRVSPSRSKRWRSGCSCIARLSSRRGIRYHT